MRLHLSRWRECSQINFKKRRRNSRPHGPRLPREGGGTRARTISVGSAPLVLPRPPPCAALFSSLFPLPQLDNGTFSLHWNRAVTHTRTHTHRGPRLTSKGAYLPRRNITGEVVGAHRGELKVRDPSHTLWSECEWTYTHQSVRYSDQLAPSPAFNGSMHSFPSSLHTHASSM